MSDSQVQEIKERIDIVELVREFVQLHPAGQYFKARCPFHSEKTPSFMVSPDRGTWHCFGCNEGGDAFSFLQKVEGMTFPEALEALARRAGVVLQRTRTKTVDGVSDVKRRLHDLLFDAAQVYHTILLQSSGGQEAREYVVGRGVKDETRRSFMIGFAPDRWDVLYNVLVKRGYDVKEMIAAGMVVRNDRGRVYDRFRDRIMFPIWDHHGNVVGFTGRLLHDDGKSGKYVNTPQTAVFDKGRLLYGLDRAKQAIRKADEVIIVEGQMDVVAAHQAGFLNTVASSGTALGEVQLKLLKRYCACLKVAFDADDAGQAAALRGIGLALAEGFDVRVICLRDEDGKDPDDCIGKSVERWREVVEHAQPYIAWVIDQACVEFDSTQARGKREIAKRVLALIGRMQSPVEQDHWISELSHRLQISVDALRAEMTGLIPKNIERVSSDNTVVFTKTSKTASEMLLGLALKVGNPVVDLQIFSVRFFSPQYHPLVESLKKGYDDDSTIELRDQLLMRVAYDFPSLDDDALKKEYQILLGTCKKQYKQKQIAVLAQHIRDAEMRGDDKRVAQLMDAYRTLHE